MNIADAQKEMRLRFAGGFFGQMVSSVLWLVSAALADHVSTGAAITCLVFGGFLIFPMTEFLARANKAAPLSKGNALRWLGMQVAFVLPLSMPLLLPVTRYSVGLFYPAMMILLGAHYFPFVFLYGMRIFAGLTIFLIGGGVYLALSGPHRFSVGAWYTSVVLLVFAFIAYALVKAERTTKRANQAPERTA
jgi:hypothetical protein